MGHSKCTFFNLTHTQHIFYKYSICRYLRDNDTRNLFPQPDDSDTPSWMLSVDRIFKILIPVFALTNILSVRVRVKPTIEFVNRWAVFLQEFETMFEPYYKIRLISLKRVHRCTFPFVVAAYIIPIISINFSPHRFFLVDHWFINFWSKTIFVLFIVSATVLSTIVTLLGLLTINNVYRQVQICA